MQKDEQVEIKFSVKEELPEEKPLVLIEEVIPPIVEN